MPPPSYAEKYHQAASSVEQSHRQLFMHRMRLSKSLAELVNYTQKKCVHDFLLVTHIPAIRDQYRPEKQSSSQLENEIVSPMPLSYAEKYHQVATCVEQNRQQLFMDRMQLSKSLEELIDYTQQEYVRDFFLVKRDQYRSENQSSSHVECKIV